MYMASSLQTSTLLSSSSFTNSSNRIHFPKKLPKASFSVPKIQTTTKAVYQEVNNKSTEILPLEGQNNVVFRKVYDDLYNSSTNSKATIQLYTILEAIADRFEMHNNMAQQRANWNTLLLNSINMMTLTATTMAGVASAISSDGAPLLALKLSSGLLFSAATGILLIMNKIQPSQLAEEQRNAKRLFTQLQIQIETLIAIGNPTEEDVNGAMDKILALDKAYPLPLLGVMLDKFPEKFKPAVWWPETLFRRNAKSQEGKNFPSNKKIMDRKTNGWSEEMELELREVIGVIKRKDIEDYERLGNLALKVNKSLAVAGPLLTGFAMVGSAFLSQGSWAAIVTVVAGSVAAAINAFEHGGQVGMVFEMYRYCAGFFQLLESSIESNLEEKDLEMRENGEMFAIKIALQLGRSLSQLRELSRKSASCREEGIEIDEFASKLF